MDNIAEPAARAGWPDFSLYRPHPPAASLRACAQRGARADAAVDAMHRDAAAAVPMFRIVNPPLWELGHIAWFQEFWLHRGGDFAVPSMLPHADRWYDSARVAHDTRWSLDLPDWPGDARLLRGGVRTHAVAARRRSAWRRARVFRPARYFSPGHAQRGVLLYVADAGLPDAGGLAGTAAHRSTADIEIPAARLALGARPGAASCSTTKNGRTRSRCRPLRSRRAP